MCLVPPKVHRAYTVYGVSVPRYPPASLHFPSNGPWAGSTTDYARRDMVKATTPTTAIFPLRNYDPASVVASDMKLCMDYYCNAMSAGTNTPLQRQHSVHFWLQSTMSITLALQ